MYKTRKSNGKINSEQSVKNSIEKTETSDIWKPLIPHCLIVHLFSRFFYITLDPVLKFEQIVLKNR